ncbi:hypothetical protein SAMN04487764_2775 [Gillisia sp. Hel1_33_143]|uniref:hypothetical protein n=1 Tax=Gillisia sp. Hel1_33_143 TaxID=1336796 RepID=UPI00087D944A|nr:hypothetical protein [Gillisia sp. Hel1_33_143]SDS67534.1 hypothetical protein SAMN04487764_2775 [Gillisia sp. Hel1_33_143]
MTRKKIELGDIFELKIIKGFIYLQCVNIPEDKTQVELIRVYYDIHRTRPSDFTLIQKSSYFYIGFVLQAASNKKIIEKVCNIPIEKDFELPRYFRTKNLSGDGWHIVDAIAWKRQSFKKLNNNQKQLSPWGIWNDTLIKERMNNGWKLENWDI